MKIVVGRVSDFSAGESRVVEVDRHSIGVFRIGTKFYALNNSCPHQGGPLCLGRVSAGLSSDEPGQFDLDDDLALVACPWHGWEYDVETGQSFRTPDEPGTRGYNVSIERGDLIANAGGPQRRELVRGPYVAETYDVQVDEDYVVVDTSRRRQQDQER